ncbi:class I adenylate-forming enzyme family protein [Dyella tabacisoli]|uniref:class I adenylate-forming enzyme family protein n=1 Tax=Dyella tabacisoli TaxID=2282381 RepID=UPI0013B43B31|nr:class I adenylate-forming enzyme family protein [Dyella tabacisoli]
MTPTRSLSATTISTPPETIGAGNFLDHACATTDVRAPKIFLDKPLVVQGEQSLDELSLLQIKVLSCRLAASLFDLGIRAKDPVAVYLDESAGYLLCYLALNHIGAIPAFLNSGLSGDIASAYIARIGAVAVIADAARIEILSHTEALPETVSLYDFGVIELADASKSVAAYRHHDDDPVLLAHTSGTTGIPKAVQFNHQGFFHGVRRQFGKTMGGRVLCTLPLSHASCISVLMSILLRGGQILLQSQRDPASLVAAIEKFKPEMFAAFPKVFVDLCRLDLDAYDLSSVSWWLSTGDANHESHIRKLVRQGSRSVEGIRRKGSLFIDNFGASEFGYAIFRNVHSLDTDNYGRCIGLPFDWIDVAILDTQGTLVKPGQVGLLGVRSPSVTAGYWNDSVTTQRTRLAGYWLTGDLAYRADDGQYFHVDRISDRIDLSADTLFSCALEERIMRHVPEVFECTVVEVSGSEGKALTLLVELQPREEDTVGELAPRINKLMESWGHPVFTSILKQSAHEHVGLTGKKLKRKLRSESSTTPIGSR